MNVTDFLRAEVAEITYDRTGKQRRLDASLTGLYLRRASEEHFAPAGDCFYNVISHALMEIGETVSALMVRQAAMRVLPHEFYGGEIEDKDVVVASVLGAGYNSMEKYLTCMSQSAVAANNKERGKSWADELAIQYTAKALRLNKVWDEASTASPPISQSFDNSDQWG